MINQSSKLIKCRTISEDTPYGRLSWSVSSDLPSAVYTSPSSHSHYYPRYGGHSGSQDGLDSKTYTITV